MGEPKNVKTNRSSDVNRRVLGPQLFAAMRRDRREPPTDPITGKPMLEPDEKGGYRTSCADDSSVWAITQEGIVLQTKADDVST
jgi:hypothetical protein